MDDKWATRKTLLLNASDQDNHDAWEDFVEHYGTFIYHIIYKMGVSRQDSDDLAQIIILQLWRKLYTYQSEKGKFRPWLSTVIRNAVSKYFNQNKLKEVSFMEEIAQKGNDIDDMIQQEWETHLTESAMKKVKLTFSETFIKVFLMSVEGIPSDEIAKTLDIAHSSVKVIKSRVKKSFVFEMKKLLKATENQ